ncbi:roadblock/LC7 domain-containing protein [Nocardia bovistercoris]|uniref:Roadblock/LC7 domain-containing protein n=1 Tax=Nocardia bovistercoris TaxID=2785916 RepID=A0A931IB86_9NOCA|nr:roadblock/LC7 domain-containing protein [Nocardia bovistercoris]MBH0776680.1 roadblock/LC7 domain-containing protein [Nocardia bovistercoris]
MNDEAANPVRDTLDWLVDSLIERTPRSEHAVILSADGLPLARSRSLLREDAEHLSAMASAVHSLARGVGHRFGKGITRQIVIELDDGYLVVTEAGQGTCLALLATIDADLGLIAYEMNVMVGQVRDQLTAVPRTPSGALRVPLKP